MQIIRKIALASIKDRKLLMVRSSKNPTVFYNLGGKLEEGETDVDCLMREIKEEVGSDIDKKTIDFLHEFQTDAHGKPDTMVNIRLYKGKLLGHPKPSSEIAEIRYFSSDASEEIVSKMGKSILIWLKQQNYID